MTDLFEIIKRVVDNSFEGHPPSGGVSLSLRFEPDTLTYHTNVEGGHCGAEAPTLELAVMALEHLDEGENVLVGPDGYARCPECRGEGCDECDSVRVPHRWPDGGLLNLSDREILALEQLAKVGHWPSGPHFESRPICERLATIGLVKCVPLEETPDWWMAVITDAGKAALKSRRSIDG